MPSNRYAPTDINSAADAVPISKVLSAGQVLNASLPMFVAFGRLIDVSAVQ